MGLHPQFFPYDTKHLDVSKNILMNLPESIVLVNKLKVLVVSFNQLIMLPPRLPLTLKKLDVQHNALKEFHWMTLGCNDLEELFIQSNPLQSTIDFVQMTLKWSKLRLLQLTDK